MSERQFVRVCSINDIPDGSAKAFHFGKLSLGVFHSEGQFYAINDLCTHADEHLSGGWVEGHVVECPKHAAQFDLKTGEAISLPAVDPTDVFALEVRGSDIFVELPKE